MKRFLLPLLIVTLLLAARGTEQPVEEKPVPKIEAPDIIRQKVYNDPHFSQSSEVLHSK